MSDATADYMELPTKTPDSVLRDTVFRRLARGSSPEDVLVWYGAEARPHIREWKAKNKSSA